MQNVEYKCELRDPDIAVAVCRRLGANHVGTLAQTDTYFRIPDGRLKRRETVGEPVEWIFYSREDASRPRLSKFIIYSEAEAKARYGEMPLPVWLVVKKARELWLKGGVRIHLDNVEGLGRFLEFEAMVSRRHDVATCHRAIEELRQAFGPALGEAISCSYSDLLEAESA